MMNLKKTALIVAAALSVNLFSGCGIIGDLAKGLPIFSFEKFLKEDIPGEDETKKSDRLFDDYDDFITAARNSLGVPSTVNVSDDVAAPKYNDDLKMETVYVSFSENGQKVAFGELSTKDAKAVRSIKMYTPYVSGNTSTASSGSGQTTTNVTNNIVTPTPPPATVPVQPKGSSYQVVKSNATFVNAEAAARKAGGHLVYINSADEFNHVCSLADAKGLKVFWVGADIINTANWNNTTWGDGTPLNFTRWYSNSTVQEPTYESERGEPEDYLMVFKVGNNWYYNDAANDVAYAYSGKMGYIIEY